MVSPDSLQRLDEIHYADRLEMVRQLSMPNSSYAEALQQQQRLKDAAADARNTANNSLDEDESILHELRAIVFEDMSRAVMSPSGMIMTSVHVGF
ncbi:hypothetical protein GPECTOR_29g44 [Gonium pectorale]|uniref:Uncharacterized protein n=1 Tax=Gonium pectorale TaxID=33097 RepID=A0A150GEL1_GONPE|nr:hypothetical protein GPECTOR_29g44 [Gonium pectorale]|eukprot:KXZ48266.1 hypothetical protein GPECTOR_29g44 [Gonium pectorale]